MVSKSKGEELRQDLIYNRFRSAFGDGLVVSEGERWKCQRKLMHFPTGAEIGKN